MASGGWIGINLDGVLAKYEGWVAANHIGEPTPPDPVDGKSMIDRVKEMLAEGTEVRIFTAHVYSDGTPQRNLEAEMARACIEEWCLKYIGCVLPITCTKDYGMIWMYDDRCTQVEKNTGRLIRDVSR